MSIFLGGYDAISQRCKIVLSELCKNSIPSTLGNHPNGGSDIVQKLKAFSNAFSEVRQFFEPTNEFLLHGDRFVL